ncbi:MAG: DNA-directed RNA polymerase subunit beta [Candidatus Izemoplasmatales bacterium]|nr:DNA-directed RNA polymerase subunit beta [Candidatus Izemoplasmatales bacterium]MDD4595390.1 DNA-directed RNA polymerase subunit beta [Candidatus Izemoplasmatales bacterium]
MDYKTVKYGKKRERRNYSQVKSNVELPDLIEVQTSSFEWFVNNGLKELFADISPITNFTENLEVYFGDYEFGEPKYSVLECKEKDITYSRPLRVTVRLLNKDAVDKETGEVIVKDYIKEQRIFMGDFPVMSPVGTFIINGSERVIVSQIVRSSGVFFSEEIDKKTLQRRYLGQVIPTRGAWLEYEIGSKDLLYAKIDRSKKIYMSTMIKALGLSSKDQILNLFGETQLLANTLEKDLTLNAEEAMKEVYAKIRQGETATTEGARSFFVSRLFDEKRYDLAEVGRFKINQKLDIITRIRQLIEKGLEVRFKDDIVDNQTGEIVFTNKQIIDDTLLDQLAASRRLITSRVIFDEDLESELQIHLDREARKEAPTENLNENYIEKVIRDCFVESLTITVGFNGEPKVVKLIGNNSFESRLHITTSDIIASISYYLNLFDRVGSLDDIDHLGNRRLRLIGELLKNQFRIGLAKMEKNVKDRMSTKESKDMTPQNLINIRPLTSSLKEFFGSSQLSQFMQQTNPLDEITHKRRISALGPGGLTRDRASFEVRDVHQSHYGRICPIETPEGQNIGLINSLACYVKVNKYGFMETPYLRIDKETRKVTDKLDYLSADDEQKHIIAQANVKLNDDMTIAEERVVGRYQGETRIFDREKCDYMDVSPQQIVSISTACIPFLEHDDANRALMGANMQRQAIPLLKPEAPFVGTGIEYKTAHDSGTCVIAHHDGVVECADGLSVKVRREDGNLDIYNLAKFMRSNQGTCINQKPIVEMGEIIKVGDTIADGPSMDLGELALGRNVVVAFMTWNGYNFEDAVIMNERLVKEDVYTSIHIEKYELEARDTKLGKEEITREIPNVGEDGRKYLDDKGIIIPGAEVKEGDILVGKVTPKGQTDPTPEDRLLLAIFGEKSREVRDTSLRVPHGGGGIIRSVKVFSRENEDELAPGVNEVVRVYIVQKRKISEGDKMSGRHGNKGVISKILPSEDMPYMPDGTPIDIMLNPMGIPSRMNIGQVLEIHLGMAAKRLGLHIATPVFDGVKQSDLEAIMKESGMDDDGKTVLYDGRTGQPFDNRVSVGVMYMIKLDHMVDDKLHARSVGPYTLVTQQPMGGKAQNGGQRFGEMEVWALEAYGAAYTLQEMLTVKSDDIIGRNKVFRAIVDGQPIPDPSLPESFRVLTRELRSLGIYVELISKETGINEVNRSLVDDDVEDYITKYGFQS